MNTSALGNIASGLGSLVGTGAQLYGQQNAAEAVEQANQGAITNQQNYLGNINSLYSPYTSTGAAATSALGAAEGLNGQAPNYSGFENMPGYQFAVQQGTQAIQRQAAASGNAYTPNTGAAIGQYVTGTAMQDYNTYVQQLQQTAGMGATATGQLGNITYNTGANTSQLMANTGQAQAGMYTGMGQTIGSGVGNIASGLGSIASGVGSLFNGSGYSTSGYSTSGNYSCANTLQQNYNATLAQYGGSGASTDNSGITYYCPYGYG
jgi:hypothetical protein